MLQVRECHVFRTHGFTAIHTQTQSHNASGVLHESWSRSPVETHCTDCPHTKSPAGVGSDVTHTGLKQPNIRSSALGDMLAHLHDSDIIIASSVHSNFSSKIQNTRKQIVATISAIRT